MILYGQTSSGKTFTLFGEESSPSAPLAHESPISQAEIKSEILSYLQLIQSNPELSANTFVPSGPILNLNNFQNPESLSHLKSEIFKIEKSKGAENLLCRNSGKIMVSEILKCNANFGKLNFTDKKRDSNIFSNSKEKRKNRVNSEASANLKSEKLGHLESQEGMIPRFLKDIFSELEKLETSGDSVFEFEYSFFEIYKEKIYDLINQTFDLVDDGNNNFKKILRSLNLRESKHNKVFIGISFLCIFINFSEHLLNAYLTKNINMFI